MANTPQERGREKSLDVIQRELTAFARRARAAAARLHPDLPLVPYTLLAHIDHRNGCRATDLAAHYMLDRSTVSRQVGALEKTGLVERHPDPDDQRIQVLRPTAEGSAALASTRTSRRDAYRERLGSWTPDDLARFADYLLRYNAAGEGQAPQQASGDTGRPVSSAPNPADGRPPTAPTP